MSALTADQLDLLQRTRDGLPMWRGSMATDRLRREVDLLFALRLIEPDDTLPYRLTALGSLMIRETAG